MKSYDFSEASRIFKEVSESSDRSTAILLAAFVERMLELNITLRYPRRDQPTLNRLTDRDGPLSSFYSKTQLAYAMGIISSEIRDEIDCIRRIRNVFAHSAMRIDFTTTAISVECKKLYRLANMIKLDERLREDEITKAIFNFSQPRISYSISCLLVWVFLFIRLMSDDYFEKLETSETFKDMVRHMRSILKIPAHTSVA
jgi:hypothetical protein